MAKASPETIAQLEKKLNLAATDLKSVTAKKMFGCHALWAGGNIFALVWKEGRIGFKLPDEKTYQKLMDVKGSDGWKIGPKQMSHWVFVPEIFHKKSTQLKSWTEKAHKLCITPESASKPTKKAKTKKNQEGDMKNVRQNED